MKRQKYGHKRKRVKLDYYDHRARVNTRGYLTLLGVVLAALVVTAFLSPKAHAGTTPLPAFTSIFLDEDQKTDSCGRVLDSGGVPTAHDAQGNYVSPEKCKQIRAKLQSESELADQDRQNLLLAVLSSVCLALIGISLYRL